MVAGHAGPVAVDTHCCKLIQMRQISSFPDHHNKLIKLPNKKCIDSPLIL